MISYLQKKLEDFQQNPKLQTAFTDIIYQIPLTYILWPQYHIAYFSPKFCLRYKNKSYVYPLYALEDRLYYAQVKLKKTTRNEENKLHPILSYLFLHYFQEQLAVLEWENTSVRNKNSYTHYLCQQVEKLKRKLDVPTRLRKAQGHQEIYVEVLANFQIISNAHDETLRKNQALQVNIEGLELASHQIQEQQLSEIKKMEEANSALVESNSTLVKSIEKERRTTVYIKKELKRVADQFLASCHIEQKLPLLEEYQNLRHEHNLLTQKNDTLVSNNIKLANQLKKTSQTGLLEAILDRIRDRINIVLQKEYTDDHQVQLQVIKKEILQLERARTYLGKALYNLGVLYMKTGNTDKALQELQAAKFLGIKDDSILQKNK